MSSISPHYSCVPPPPIKVVPTALSIMTKCFLDIFSIFAWQSPQPPPPPINALPPPMWKRPRENPAQQFQVHHGKFNFTAANPNSSCHIRCGKFKFAAAISNSPRPFQILHGKFTKSRVYVWVARRVWARDSEGRVGHHLSSIRCEIFT